VVVTNTAIFWDTTPCDPYVNRRFGGTYNLYLQCLKSTEQETSVQRVARLYPRRWQHWATIVYPPVSPR
jgi:hypothetical protein